MRVLVTGGAGFIGSHLVDALVERGDEVVALDNLQRGSWKHIGGHLGVGAVSTVDGDIRDLETLSRASERAEVVYHLAAQSNVLGAASDTDYSFSTNVIGTYNVLKAAAAAGVRRVVFASSREVYGEPEVVPVREDTPLTAKNAYGASKVAAEAYCRVWAARGGQCQVLRLANVYGPRDRDRVIPIWLESAAFGADLELFGGEQIIDFVWVCTAVGALLAASDCELTGPINVGSGSGTPLRRLAQRVLKETGSASKLRLLPAREAEVVRFVAEITRMREILGLEPPQDPLFGLHATAAAAGGGPGAQPGVRDRAPVMEPGAAAGIALSASRLEASPNRG